MRNLAVLTTLAAAMLAFSTAPSAARWVRCATENGFCSAPAGAIIVYGADGGFTRSHSPPGGLPCNNGVFGDPMVGVHKNCFIVY